MYTRVPLRINSAFLQKHSFTTVVELIDDFVLKQPAERINNLRSWIPTSYQSLSNREILERYFEVYLLEYSDCFDYLK